MYNALCNNGQFRHHDRLYNLTIIHTTLDHMIIEIRCTTTMCNLYCINNDIVFGDKTIVQLPILTTSIIELINGQQLIQFKTLTISKKILRLMLHRLLIGDSNIDNLLGFARTLAMTYDTNCYSQ